MQGNSKGGTTQIAVKHNTELAAPGDISSLWGDGEITRDNGEICVARELCADLENEIVEEKVWQDVRKGGEEICSQGNLRPKHMNGNGFQRSRISSIDR